ncbi:MAG: flagellar basal body-associated FliL family protein [Candidatus Neomarinimicrobiota bacterium]
MSEVGDQDTPGAEENGDEGKRSLPIVKLAVIVVTVLLLGLLAYILTQRVIVPKLTGLGDVGDKVRDMRENVQKTRKEKKKAAKLGPVIAHPISGITANTAGSRGRRFVTFDIILETRVEDARDEMVTREYQIRDAMISYFGGRTVNELATRQFMSAAKDTVKALINGILETGDIDTMYFTKFLIQ